MPVEGGAGYAARHLPGNVSRASVNQPLRLGADAPNQFVGKRDWTLAP